MHAHSRDSGRRYQAPSKLSKRYSGAVLVNADTYWCVEGFLKSWHFPEEIHANSMSSWVR